MLAGFLKEKITGFQCYVFIELDRITEKKSFSSSFKKCKSWLNEVHQYKIIISVQVYFNNNYLFQLKTNILNCPILFILMNISPQILYCLFLAILNHSEKCHQYLVKFYYRGTYSVWGHLKNFCNFFEILLCSSFWKPLYWGIYIFSSFIFL